MYTVQRAADAHRPRKGASSARAASGAVSRSGAYPRLSRSACACGGGCPKCAAREDPHPAGARYGDAAPVDAAQPAEAAATPQYRDCSERITGITDANERLETARQRAREYVGAAWRVLDAAPAAGTTYETALGRHFIAPDAADRAAIAATYRQILNTLVVRNFICNSDNICGTLQAFWIEADDLIHVCRPFWPLSPMCRAIILIHEGAHDAGISVAGTHPPNRGSTLYPAGNVAPPPDQTTAGRMNNPDAYAFFAAHIWRSTDTGLTCV